MIRDRAAYAQKARHARRRARRCWMFPAAFRAPPATACSKPLYAAATLERAYTKTMAVARYVYWQDGDHWLGYFEEYPDYMTQGETLEDLQENVKDLFRDLTSGQIPGIRRIAELQVQ